MDETTALDYEFEGFRLDTALQVLVSPAGEVLPLPSRAFATLHYLVERAGETVDKSALMAKVWPTTVVAENNLNQCILALRRAFGEASGERRFILTIPGRGFKFVAPVRIVPREHAAPITPIAIPAPEETVASSAPPVSRSGQGTRWLFAGLLLIAGLTAGLWLWRGHHQAVTDPADYAQLTDVTDTAVGPVLSPDGRMLAFIRDGSEFRGRGQIWIKVMPDGEPTQLTHAEGQLWAPAFSPDGKRVTYSVIDDRRGTWDTWTIPVDGRSAATKLLPNAQALTYIGPNEVMYSEFDGGQHLSVATSMEDRSAHRQVYSPEHQRGMAHFSYLSPDRKSVLVAEMGPMGDFRLCRLVPFDGNGPGYEVGPPDSSCRSAAWSPDGAWMYFSAVAPSGVHLWRQRFPHGVPEQITFGPSQEQTVFATPDGRSLLTAIGLSHSNLWLHDAQGERLLTNEGNAIAPWLSPDARHVYFIEVHVAHSISLMRLEIATGRKETLLKGYNVFSFDVTPDERQVVFTTPGVRQSLIWVAPLDGHAAPKLLVFGGDQPSFGGGYVFYRRVEEHANYLHRMRTDASDDTQLLPDPIIDFFAAAPDGKAVLVSRPSADIIKETWAIPIDSPGAARVINRANSPARWSSDGKTLYVELNIQDRVAARGSAVALPTGPDDLPLTTQLAADAQASVIPYRLYNTSVAADPSVYAYVKSETRQNIYRVALH